MFSEHPGEAIHHVFEKLNRQYVYLGSDLKRLDSVMSRCIRVHDPRVLEFVRSRPINNPKLHYAQHKNMLHAAQKYAKCMRAPHCRLTSRTRPMSG
jgi:hypothetical protein